jgi:hypothetical protein
MTELKSRLKEVLGRDVRGLKPVGGGHGATVWRCELAGGDVVAVKSAQRAAKARCCAI